MMPRPPNSYFWSGWPAAALVLGCGGPGMMGRSLMEEAMQPADIARVEAYLRKTVGSDRIRIVTPTSHGGSIEVWAGSEFLEPCTATMKMARCRPGPDHDS